MTKESQFTHKSLVRRGITPTGGWGGVGALLSKKNSILVAKIGEKPLILNGLC